MPPLHLSTTFQRDPAYADWSGDIYGRPDNPTVREAEAVIGALEGAAATLALGSGMSAAIALFLSLGPGAHIVAPRRMYWALRNWLMKDAPAHGLDVAFCDTEELPALASAIAPLRTKLVWLETPSNPMWGVSDIAGAASLAHAAGALLAVELDLRDAGLHPAARTRRRRRHAFGDKIPQRPFRRDRGRIVLCARPTRCSSGRATFARRTASSCIRSRPSC